MVTQGSDWTYGPVTLQCLIQSRGQGCINHGGHTVWTLWPADSWKEGWLRGRDSMDQSDWCLKLLCSHAWISPFACLNPRPTGRQFRSQVLRGGLLEGFKGSLCQLVQNQGKVPRGDAPLPLDLSLWKLSGR